jgi:hypothetical protein
MTAAFKKLLLLNASPLRVGRSEALLDRVYMSTKRDAAYDMLGRVNVIKDRGALTVLLVALQAHAKVLEDQEAKAEAAEADAASAKADKKAAESTKAAEERAAEDTKEIEETESETQFALRGMEIKCGEQALLYRMSNSYYRRLYFQYTVPCMVLTTSVTLLASIWPEGLLPLFQKILVASLSALATLLTGFLSLFGYQEKMAYFEMAAKAADGLVAKCMYARKGHKSQEDCRQIIAELEANMVEVQSNAPSISVNLEQQFRKQKNAEEQFADLKKKKKRLKKKTEEQNDGPAKAGQKSLGATSSTTSFVGSSNQVATAPVATDGSSLL